MTFSEFLSLSKKNYSTTPLELKIFFFFSLVVFLSALIIREFGSKQLYESIIAITDWSPSSSYLIYAMFTGFLIFLPVKKNMIKIRNILILLLLTHIVFAAIPYLNIDKSDFVNPNPYLRISEWRPLWVFLIPSLWILILLSPRVKKYFTAEG